MKAIKLPSKDLLNELFKYNQSGALYWKKRPANNVNINLPAGSLDNTGYIRIKILGIKYLEHRLIFKMINNIEPDYIDHINNIKDDNRIENLQEISFSQNKLKGGLYPYKNNTSGYGGIHFDKKKKKWIARISVNNERIYIGQYNNLDNAVFMRNAMYKELTVK